MSLKKKRNIKRFTKKKICISEILLANSIAIIVTPVGTGLFNRSLVLNLKMP